MSTVGAPVASKVEVGHVLFIDIVGWSRMALEKQTETVELLNEAVESSRDYVQALAAREIISVPAGDGMALVFLQRPDAPAKVAVHLSKKLAELGKFEARMGLHMGPIYRMRDISMKENVAGGGINMAKRVLDAGEPGHILVSQSAYDVLCELEAWQGCLHNLGEFRVKHGVPVHLYNLYGPGFGNSSPLFEVEPLATQTPTQKRADEPKSATSRKIVLIYKRNALPDVSVLAMLESRLRDAGHNVFVDQHLSIGLNWAKEIENKIRDADAVIPLVSLGSISSEFLLDEIEIAAKAREAKGHPFLLPVRVGYAGKLPDELGRYLDEIQYFLWEDHGDDVVLLNQIEQALQRNQNELVATATPEQQFTSEKPYDPPLINMPSITDEAVGGAMPVNSRFYIERKLDKDFFDAVDHGHAIVLAKGARQMGKSSLLVRGLDRARQKGWKVVLTDFQKLNEQNLSSIENVYKALADLIVMGLNLDFEVEDVWKPSRAPNMNFERFLTKVLAGIDTHLVWALDEADRLLVTPYASEVFGFFRALYNERAANPLGPWPKLTQAFAYATEAHLFIADLNQSPFNVGTHVNLEDFTIAEVQKLNVLYEKPLRSDSELAALYQLVGGHPFLTRKSLYMMVNSQMSLGQFSDEAIRDDGPVGDHLKRMLLLLSKDPALTEDLREVLRGKPCPDPKSFYRLRSAGVLSGDQSSPKLRCQLYERYLTRHLLGS